MQDNKEVDHPLLTATQYLCSAQGLFSMQKELLNDVAQLKFYIIPRVLIPNLSTQEIEENQLGQVFHQPPSQYIAADQFSSMSYSLLFGDEPSFLEKADVMTIRTLLFPEIKITKGSKNDKGDIHKLVAALDVEQERIAKRLPYGHYMVTGVPSSGKTVLLLARAVHLIREYPEWKIRVLTYNKSLKAKIENKLNSIAEELSFMDIRLKNIIVSTFHNLAKDIASVAVPKGVNKNWWGEELPSIALERAKANCDAILIDGYQDILDAWIPTMHQIMQSTHYSLQKLLFGVIIQKKRVKHLLKGRNRPSIGQNLR